MAKTFNGKKFQHRISNNNKPVSIIAESKPIKFGMGKFAIALGKKNNIVKPSNNIKIIF